ncbi:methyltransferase domain-containing protein [Acidithrix sp. C25]|uniref:class I SAM-dependent methyltransferase n=1 Tax=Acidithrix sp. C25 TaxID=1671482 RepID=UPI00191B9E66|nr:methyltransferase domain-containing protein [Acidithrix sp. C25]CAG4934413.1 unnamed protein product [Acidithrix sp. C25]
MNPLFGAIERNVGSLRSCRVVELGAIGGIVSAPYTNVISNLIVVEPSAEVITKLTQEADPDSPRYEVHNGGLDELAFINIDSADTVISALGLLSTSDPDRLLRSVKRILRPSGSFIFSVAHPLLITNSLIEPPSDYRYFESHIVDTQVLGFGLELPQKISLRPISKLFSLVQRAGLYVDTFEEISIRNQIKQKTQQQDKDKDLPDFIIVKVKKR